MRFIDNLCPPALLYLIYVVIHTGLDLSLGRFATAGIKIIMGVAGTVILDSLCGVDLGIVSWAIVATPFIMVALASSISLGLGLDRMVAVAARDGFANPIKADDKKNRDIYVTQEKNQDALPISTDYVQ
jgi:hypothetical protein